VANLRIAALDPREPDASLQEPAHEGIVRIEENGRVRVSAKADYAVRAAVELAAAEHTPVKAEDVANGQGIPLNFLVKILHELRLAGLVGSQRGPEGGHQLARPAAEISVADVLRAVEGPLAEVRGTPPESLQYMGSAQPLQRVWVALRTNVRSVLETVTLADIAGDQLPADVDALADEDESWVTR
jgi:Rrf2 family protein